MNFSSNSNSSEQISIEKAFTELPPAAFAVWIRLLVASDSELSAGRVKIAELLGYSEAQSNTILRTLKHYNYIRIRNGATSYVPSEVVILKRGLLSGRNKFTKMARMLGGDLPPEDVGGKPLSDFDESRRASEVEAPPVVRPAIEQVADHQPRNAFELAVTHGIGEILNRIGKLEHLHFAQKLGSGHPNYSAFTRQITGTKHDQNLPTKKVKCWVAGEVPGLSGAQGKTKQNAEKISGRGVDLKKLLSKKKEEREKVRANSLLRGRARAVDWSKFNRETASGVSFSPSKSQRIEYKKLLARKENDPERSKLINRLAWQLAQEYARYVLMKTGKECFLLPKDYQRAQLGVVEMLAKNVSPKAVMQYWDGHLHTYHLGKKMSYPNLTLLCSNWGVEQAACALLDASGEPVGPTPTAKERAAPPKTHGFSDLNDLDKRLRPALKAAGHEVEHMNDELMLFIQKAAVTMARGVDQFIDPSVKPHVKWAAKHLGPRWIEALKAAR